MSRHLQSFKHIENENEYNLEENIETQLTRNSSTRSWGYIREKFMSLRLQKLYINTRLCSKNNYKYTFSSSFHNFLNKFL